PRGDELEELGWADQAPDVGRQDASIAAGHAAMVLRVVIVLVICAHRHFAYRSRRRLRRYGLRRISRELRDGGRPARAAGGRQRVVVFRFHALSVPRVGHQGNAPSLVRLACKACHNRRGVAGMSNCFTPAERSASITAFMRAGIEPVTPPSPTPLAPSGLVAVGTAWSVTLSPPTSPARGMA